MVMQSPAVGMNKQKGDSHVVDACCGTGNLVAAWIGEWLYDGQFYSCPAGRCHHHSADQSHSGAETVVAI